MESLFLSFCLSVYDSGIPSTACNKIILASYSHSQIEKEINDITSRYEKKGKVFIKENKEIVYPAIVLGSVYNTIHTKELKLSVPTEFLKTKISVDIKPDTQYNYLLEWKWSI